MSDYNINNINDGDDDFLRKLRELSSRAKNFIAEMELKCMRILGHNYVDAKNDIRIVIKHLNSNDVNKRWAAVSMLVKYHKHQPHYSALLVKAFLSESDENIIQCLITAIATEFEGTFDKSSTMLLLNVCMNEAYSERTRICAYIRMFRIRGEPNEYSLYLKIRSVSDFDYIFLNSLQ
jgi:predicted nucleic-acid-binding protein